MLTLPFCFKICRFVSFTLGDDFVCPDELDHEKTSVSSEDSETGTWVTGAFRVMEESLPLQATKEHPVPDSKSFKKQ